MNWKTTLLDLFTQSQDETWLLHVLIIFALTVLAALCKKIIYKRITDAAEKTDAVWDECLIHATTGPLSVMLWVLGLFFIAHITANHFGASETIIKSLQTSKSLILFVLLSWFMIDLVRHTENDYIAQSRKGKTKLDQTSIRAISQISRIIVTISIGLISLDMLGVPTAGIMTAGGIGGVAVGFASKDLLANVFGGLVIYLDRPFAIGDWIKIADKKLEGTVEQIGWRTTMLRTFDKRALYIPNGIFLLASIENPSRMTNRRIKASVGLRFQDVNKIKFLLGEIEQMLQARDDIDTTQTLYVRLTEIANSSLNFTIYCFTKSTNWVKFLEVQQDVLLKVLQMVQNHDAECAFPTTTLHIAGADESSGAIVGKPKKKIPKEP